MRKNKYSNPENFINRELSWLEFNERVLEEARDRNNPLFERIKFLSIVNSNLDEFFMVRVASLKDLVNVGFNKPDPSGLNPKKQLKAISIRTHRMYNDMYSCYNRSLNVALRKKGIKFLKPKFLTEDQKIYLHNYFKNYLFPILTPLAVDASRPFPLILNKSINLGVLLKNENIEDEFFFATVQVPNVIPRLIKLPSKEDEKNYILLEDVIKLYVQQLFTGSEIICCEPYRITRNADLTIEEDEAEDLLIEIEKSLKKRKWGQAIRLEVDSNIDSRIVDILREELEIHHRDIIYVNGPLDLTFLMKTYKLEGFDGLKYPEFTSQTPEDLLGEEDIFKKIREKDILLHHPFESFDSVVEFVQKAAHDPNVLAIKQTLYRVSGDSSIIEALAKAAENGKEVTVLVELKARFDEENNIIWAKKLEKAGCHVIYGLVGLKTHSKIILVVRREEDGIKRYAHLGTGNYNDITAKLYTDIGLMTVNEYFCSDVSAIFNMLSGYSEPPELYKLSYAPNKLRQKFMELINREMENALEGREAIIIAKVNSLVDPKIIEALYEASCAGVKINLIVRGICCLRPGLSGVSENIEVKSIIGRYLEHTRIYYFYNNGEDDIYISSADWMTRNLDRRVELLVPVEDGNLIERLVNILKIYDLDTVKSRVLNSEGLYKKIDKRGKKVLEAQDYFQKQAVKKVKRFKKNSNDITFDPVTNTILE